MSCLYKHAPSAKWGCRVDLKIGVVSKLSGFSPSGIRYFEERGIVSPSHGRDGTYRSFDLPDVARLLECRNYRECGCDTAEIAALLSHGSLCDVDAALHDCETRLRHQIEAAQRLEAFLSHRRQLVDLASHYVPGRIEVLHSPATYWVPLWMPGERDEVEARIPSEEEGFPIPYADSSLLFPVEQLDVGIKCEPAVGYAVRRQYVDAPPSLTSSFFLYPRKCAHSIIRVRRDFTPFEDDLAALISTIRERGLAPEESAFTHRVCTLYDSSDELRFDEIWVPVK